MAQEFNYNFLFLTHKLNGVLSMLNVIAGNEMEPIEYKLIKENLEETDYEEGIWTDFHIDGVRSKLDLLFAYQSKDDKESINIIITSKDELHTEIEMISIFQSLFERLDLSN